MKKILLSFAFVLATVTCVNAQITVLSENFNGTPPSGWTMSDADADGKNWGVQDYATHTRPGVASGGKMLVSFSYDNPTNTALNPNNYIFSPVMDLSAHTGKVIMLKWKAAAVDANFSAETYSVYASTTNTVAGMLASTTKLTPISLTGVVDLTANELDISAFQSAVYFAFRHHDSSDEFALAIDDIQVLALDPASSEQFFAENFNMYPNPTTDVLNISSKNGLNASEIRITDMTGRVVKVQKEASTVNVSNLAAGTYLIDITTKEGKATSKFIKK
jgi:hypothetical protein